MGRRSREKSQRKLIDYPKLAEAIHRVVCSITKDDGSRWCLDYASIGCAWLNAHSGQTHALGGGQLAVHIQNYRVSVVAFEHFWIMRGVPGHWTHIDFATRHNPAILLRNKAAGGKDVTDKLTAANFDAGKLGVPYYVGDGADVREVWEYVVAAEPTDYANGEYRRLKPNLAEAVRRVNLLLSGKS